MSDVMSMSSSQHASSSLRPAATLRLFQVYLPFFSLCLTLESEYHKNLSYAGMAIQYMQLLAFMLNPHFQHGSIGSLLSTSLYWTHLPFWDSTFLPQHKWVFFLILWIAGMGLVILPFCLFMYITFTHCSTVRERPLMVFFRANLHSITTILFIPLMQCFLSQAVCYDSAVAGVSPTQCYDQTSTQALPALSIVGVALLAFQTYFIETIMYTDSDDEERPMSRKHYLVDLVSITWRLATCILFQLFVSTNDDPQSNILPLFLLYLNLTLVLMTVLHAFFLPYTYHHTTRLFTSTYLVAALCAIILVLRCAFITSYVDSSSSGGAVSKASGLVRNVDMLLILSFALPVALLGWCVADVRVNVELRQSLPQLLDAQAPYPAVYTRMFPTGLPLYDSVYRNTADMCNEVADGTVTAMQSHVSLETPFLTHIYVYTDVEVATRFIAVVHQLTGKFPTTQMLQLATRIYLKAQLRFHSSVTILLGFAMMLSTYTSKRNLALAQCEKTNAMECSVPTRYRAYRLIYRLKLELRIRDASFQKMSEVTKRSHKELLVRLYDFWNRLLTQQDRSQVLAAYANMARTRQRTNDLFLDALTQQSCDSELLLKYADFVRHVMLQPYRADKLRRFAEHEQEEQRRQHGRFIANVPYRIRKHAEERRRLLLDDAGVGDDDGATGGSSASSSGAAAASSSSRLPGSSAGSGSSSGSAGGTSAWSLSVNRTSLWLLLLSLAMALGVAGFVVVAVLWHQRRVALLHLIDRTALARNLRLLGDVVAMQYWTFSPTKTGVTASFAQSGTRLHFTRALADDVRALHTRIVADADAVALFGGGDADTSTSAVVRATRALRVVRSSPTQMQFSAATFFGLGYRYAEWIDDVAGVIGRYVAQPTEAHARTLMTMFAGLLDGTARDWEEASYTALAETALVWYGEDYILALVAATVLFIWTMMCTLMLAQLSLMTSSSQRMLETVSYIFAHVPRTRLQELAMRAKQRVVCFDRAESNEDEMATMMMTHGGVLSSSSAAGGTGGVGGGVSDGNALVDGSMAAHRADAETLAAMERDAEDDVDGDLDEMDEDVDADETTGATGALAAAADAESDAQSASGNSRSSLGHSHSGMNASGMHKSVLSSSANAAAGGGGGGVNEEHHTLSAHSGHAGATTGGGLSASSSRRQFTSAARVGGVLWGNDAVGSGGVEKEADGIIVVTSHLRGGGGSYASASASAAAGDERGGAIHRRARRGRRPRAAAAAAGSGSGSGGYARRRGRRHQQQQRCVFMRRWWRWWGCCFSTRTRRGEAVSAEGRRRAGRRAAEGESRRETASPSHRRGRRAAEDREWNASELGESPYNMKDKKDENEDEDESSGDDASSSAEESSSRESAGSDSDDGSELFESSDGESAQGTFSSQTKRTRSSASASLSARSGGRYASRRDAGPREVPAMAHYEHVFLFIFFCCIAALLLLAVYLFATSYAHVGTQTGAYERLARYGDVLHRLYTVLWDVTLLFNTGATAVDGPRVVARLTELRHVLPEELLTAVPMTRATEVSQLQAAAEAMTATVRTVLQQSRLFEQHPSQTTSQFNLSTHNATSDAVGEAARVALFGGVSSAFAQFHESVWSTVSASQQALAQASRDANEASGEDGRHRQLVYAMAAVSALAVVLFSAAWLHVWRRYGHDERHRRRRRRARHSRHHTKRHRHGHHRHRHRRRRRSGRLGVYAAAARPSLPSSSSSSSSSSSRAAMSKMRCLHIRHALVAVLALIALLLVFSTSVLYLRASAAARTSGGRFSRAVVHEANTRRAFLWPLLQACVAAQQGSEVNPVVVLDYLNFTTYSNATAELIAGREGTFLSEEETNKDNEKDKRLRRNPAYSEKEDDDEASEFIDAGGDEYTSDRQHRRPRRRIRTRHASAYVSSSSSSSSFAFSRSLSASTAPTTAALSTAVDELLFFEKVALAMLSVDFMTYVQPLSQMTWDFDKEADASYVRVHYYDGNMPASAASAALRYTNTTADLAAAAALRVLKARDLLSNARTRDTVGVLEAYWRQTHEEVVEPERHRLTASRSFMELQTRVMAMSAFAAFILSLSFFALLLLQHRWNVSACERAAQQGVVSVTASYHGNNNSNSNGNHNSNGMMINTNSNSASSSSSSSSNMHGMGAGGTAGHAGAVGLAANHAAGFAVPESHTTSSMPPPSHNSRGPGGIYALLLVAAGVIGIYVYLLVNITALHYRGRQVELLRRRAVAVTSSMIAVEQWCGSAASTAELRTNMQDWYALLSTLNLALSNRSYSMYRLSDTLDTLLLGRDVTLPGAYRYGFDPPAVKPPVASSSSSSSLSHMTQKPSMAGVPIDMDGADEKSYDKMKSSNAVLDYRIDDYSGAGEDDGNDAADSEAGSSSATPAKLDLLSFGLEKAVAQWMMWMASLAEMNLSMHIQVNTSNKPMSRQYRAPPYPSAASFFTFTNTDTNSVKVNPFHLTREHRPATINTAEEERRVAFDTRRSDVHPINRAFSPSFITPTTSNHIQSTTTTTTNNNNNNNILLSSMVLSDAQTNEDSDADHAARIVATMRGTAMSLLRAMDYSSDLLLQAAISVEHRAMTQEVVFASLLLLLVLLIHGVRTALAMRHDREQWLGYRLLVRRIPRDIRERVPATAEMRRFGLDDDRDDAGANFAVPISDMLSVAAVAFNDGGTVVSFSRFAEEAFGYAAAEVLGNNVTLLLPEQMAMKCTIYLERYCSSHGDPVTRQLFRGMDGYGRRKSGEQFEMELAVQELRCRNGERVFVAFVEDISERTALQSQLELNAFIQDEMPYPLIAMDTLGTILRFNKAAEECFGRLASDVVEQNVKILMPEETAVRHDGYLATYLRTKRRHMIGHARRVRGLRRNGEEFAMLLRVREIVRRGGGGSIYLGVVQDLSHDTEMDESMLLGDLLRDSAATPTIATDLFGRILFFSRSAESVFGYPAAEVLQRNCKLLMPPMAGEQYDDFLKSYRQSWGHRSAPRVDRVFVGRHRDGSLLWLTVNWREVASPDAMHASLVGFFYERTEERRACARRRVSAMAAERQDSALLILSAEGRIVRVHAATEAEFGYRREELLGQRVRMLMAEAEAEAEAEEEGEEDAFHGSRTTPRHRRARRTAAAAAASASATSMTSTSVLGGTRAQSESELLASPSAVDPLTGMGISLPSTTAGVSVRRFMARRKNGSHFPVEATVREVREESGETTTAAGAAGSSGNAVNSAAVSAAAVATTAATAATTRFVVCLRNITRNLRVEQDRMVADFIHDVSLTPMLVLDVKGVVMRCNEAMERLMKGPAEALVGRPLGDWFVAESTMEGSVSGAGVSQSDSLLFDGLPAADGQGRDTTKQQQQQHQQEEEGSRGESAAPALPHRPHTDRSFSSPHTNTINSSDRNNNNNNNDDDSSAAGPSMAVDSTTTAAAPPHVVSSGLPFVPTEALHAPVTRHLRIMDSTVLSVEVWGKEVIGAQAGQARRFVVRLRDTREVGILEYEKLRNAVMTRSSPVPLIYFGWDGRLTHINPAAEATLGWTRAEATASLHLRDIFVEDTLLARLVPANKTSAMRGGAGRQVRAFTEARTKSGALLPVLLTMREIVTEYDRLRNIFVAYVQDLSSSLRIHACTETIRAYLELNPHAMVVLDANNAILSCNGSACRLFGLPSPWYLAGEHVSRIMRYLHDDAGGGGVPNRADGRTMMTTTAYTEEDRDAERRRMNDDDNAEEGEEAGGADESAVREFAQTYLAARRVGLAPLRTPLRCRRLDGTRFPAALTLVEVADPFHGRIFLCCVEDRSEAARLSCARATLRGLLHIAADPLFVVDRAGVICQLGTATARCFGYAEAHELIGQPLSRLIDDAATASTAEAAVHSPNTNYHHSNHNSSNSHKDDAGAGNSLVSVSRKRDVVARRRDGSTFAAELSLRATGLDDGSSLYLVQVVDTTQINELHARRKLNMAIMEHSPVPIVVFTHQGIIRTFSPAAERFFGRSAAEVMGTLWSSLITRYPASSDDDTDKEEEEEEDANEKTEQHEDAEKNRRVGTGPGESRRKRASADPKPRDDPSDRCFRFSYEDESECEVGEERGVQRRRGRLNERVRLSRCAHLHSGAVVPVDVYLTRLPSDSSGEWSGGESSSGGGYGTHEDTHATSHNKDPLNTTSNNANNNNNSSNNHSRLWEENVNVSDSTESGIARSATPAQGGSGAALFMAYLVDRSLDGAVDRARRRRAAVLRGLPLPLLLVSQTGVILHGNAALEQLLGYRAVELKQQHISVLVPFAELLVPPPSSSSSSSSSANVGAGMVFTQAHVRLFTKRGGVVPAAARVCVGHGDEDDANHDRVGSWTTAERSLVYYVTFTDLRPFQAARRAARRWDGMLHTAARPTLVLARRRAGEADEEAVCASDYACRTDRNAAALTHNHHHQQQQQQQQQLHSPLLSRSNHPPRRRRRCCAQDDARRHGGGAALLRVMTSASTNVWDGREAAEHAEDEDEEDWVIAQVNPAAARLLRCGARELTGQPASCLFRRPAVLRWLQQMAARRPLALSACSDNNTAITAAAAAEEEENNSTSSTHNHPRAWTSVTASAAAHVCHTRLRGGDALRQLCAVTRTHTLHPLHDEADTGYAHIHSQSHTPLGVRQCAHDSSAAAVNVSMEAYAVDAGHVLVQLRDRAAAAVARAHAVLHRLLAATLAEPYIIVDEQDDVVALNDAARAIFGSPAASVRTWVEGGVVSAFHGTGAECNNTAGRSDALHGPMKTTSPTGGGRGGGGLWLGTSAAGATEEEGVPPVARYSWGDGLVSWDRKLPGGGDASSLSANGAPMPPPASSSHRCGTIDADAAVCARALALDVLPHTPAEVLLWSDVCAPPPSLRRAGMQSWDDIGRGRGEKAVALAVDDDDDENENEDEERAVSEPRGQPLRRRAAVVAGAGRAVVARVTRQQRVCHTATGKAVVLGLQLTEVVCGTPATTGVQEKDNEEEEEKETHLCEGGMTPSCGREMPADADEPQAGGTRSQRGGVPRRYYVVLVRDYYNGPAPPPPIQQQQQQRQQQQRQPQPQRIQNTALAALIVARSPDATVMCSAAGIIERFNAAAGRLFDFTAKQVIGNRVEILFPRTGGKRDRVVGQWVKMCRRSETGGVIHELIAERRDGERFHAKLHVQEVRGEGTASDMLILHVKRKSG